MHPADTDLRGCRGHRHLAAHPVLGAESPVPAARGGSTALLCLTTVQIVSTTSGTAKVTERLRILLLGGASVRCGLMLSMRVRHGRAGG